MSFSRMRELCNVVDGEVVEQNLVLYLCVEFLVLMRDW